jgi:hypothetical protein
MTQALYAHMNNKRKKNGKRKKKKKEDTSKKKKSWKSRESSETTLRTYIPINLKILKKWANF